MVGYWLIDKVIKMLSFSPPPSFPSCLIILFTLTSSSSLSHPPSHLLLAFYPSLPIRFFFSLYLSPSFFLLFPSLNMPFHLSSSPSFSISPLLLPFPIHSFITPSPLFLSFLLILQNAFSSPSLSFLSPPSSHPAAPRFLSLPSHPFLHYTFPPLFLFSSHPSICLFPSLHPFPPLFSPISHLFSSLSIPPFPSSLRPPPPFPFPFPKTPCVPPLLSVPPPPPLGYGAETGNKVLRVISFVHLDVLRHPFTPKPECGI